MTMPVGRPRVVVLVFGLVFWSSLVGPAERRKSLLCSKPPELLQSPLTPSECLVSMCSPCQQKTGVREVRSEA